MVKIQQFKEKIKQYLAGCLKSWTIRFNTVGLAILSAVLIEPTAIEWMSEHDLAYIIVIGNIVLRFKTRQHLRDK